MAEVVFLPRRANNNDFLLRVTSFCRNSYQKVANSVNFTCNEIGYKLSGLACSGAHNANSAIAKVPQQIRLICLPKLTTLN